MIWECPKCGYKTNSDRIRVIHQKTEHECLQRQLWKPQSQSISIDDVTKAEIMGMLDKQGIEYSNRELKADLFAKLEGDE